jgi:3-methyladenine DNA glycosylase AlkD
MAAYMKNQFLFLGISKPKRASLEKDFLKQATRHKKVDWELVEYLWNLSEREFQYVALDYLLALKASLVAKDISAIKNLITTKPWWDTVDILATNMVGALCARNPELIESHMLPWAESENIWLARTAILFQLKYKTATHTEVLELIINNNLGSKEFFINKAIGWILREYSKTDKKWVQRFVDTHNLSLLSKREAKKYL